MKTFAERLSAILLPENYFASPAVLRWRCPKCQRQNAGGSKRCENCGKRMPKEIRKS